MASPVITGIDIGAHSIKVAQIRRTRQGISLVGLGAIGLDELMEASEGRRKHAKEGILLRDLLTDYGLRCKSAVTSVPGKRLFYRYVHVPPVPAWKLKALMEYEIEEENEGGAASVSYDYRLLDLPTKATEFTVMVAMAKNDVTEGSIEVLKEGSIQVDDIYPGATSTFNAYLLANPGEVEEVSVVLNLGADSTDMLIQSYGNFFFTRNLSNAGNSFTEALQEEFQLPFAEAESLKIERGKILPLDADDEGDEEEGARSYDDRISDSLSSVADDLANAVQASLMFCRTQLKLPALKIDKLVMCGGGAKLEGLGDYLGARLRYDVEILDLRKELDTSELEDYQRDLLDREPGRFAAAIGIAQTALARPRDVSLSLLSEKEKNRRIFRTTDKYLWYAAACLIVALGLSIYTSYQMKTEMLVKKEQFSKILDDAKKSDGSVKKRVERDGKKVAKVDAMLLRANSSKEIIDLLTLLTTPDVVPTQINLTKISVLDIDPLPFRPPLREGEEPSPSERTVKAEGMVRTVVPAPITLEHQELGTLPEKPRENYEEGLKIVGEFTENLMKVKDVVYRAFVTRADAHPKREEGGAPLVFAISIELAPKTVEGRKLLEQLALQAGTKEGGDN